MWIQNNSLMIWNHKFNSLLVYEYEIQRGKIVILEAYYSISKSMISCRHILHNSFKFFAILWLWKSRQFYSAVAKYRYSNSSVAKRIYFVYDMSIKNQRDKFLCCKIQRDIIHLLKNASVLYTIWLLKSRETNSSVAKYREILFICWKTLLFCIFYGYTTGQSSTEYPREKTVNAK